MQLIGAATHSGGDGIIHQDLQEYYERTAYSGANYCGTGRGAMPPP